MYCLNWNTKTQTQKLLPSNFLNHNRIEASNQKGKYLFICWFLEGIKLGSFVYEITIVNYNPDIAHDKAAIKIRFRLTKAEIQSLFLTVTPTS